MQHPLYNKVFPIFDIFRFEQNKNKAKQKRMNEGMEPRQHTVDDMKERRRWWVGWGWWCGGEGKRTGGGGTGQQTGASARSHISQNASRENAVAWRVCARVCGQVKNTFNLMTVMKPEVSANDFFTANLRGFRAQRSKRHQTHSVTSTSGRLSPVLQEGGNRNPLRISLL